jgi:hypothetical protein
MRKGSTFFKSDREEKPEERKSQGHGCCAHGCRLPGVFSDSTKASNEFRCWAHDRMVDGAYWGLLTKGIDENFWLFKVAEKVLAKPLMELASEEETINTYLRANNRSDLVRGQNEPRTVWVGRMRNAAYEAASAEARQRGAGK